MESQQRSPDEDPPMSLPSPDDNDNSVASNNNYNNNNNNHGSSVNPSSSSHRPPSRQVSNITMPNKKSGLFGTSSNMINSIVGAGIIGIPHAFAKSGLVAGTVLFFVVAYLTDKSLRLIVELASFHPKLKHLGVYTYEDLARIPFGRFGSSFILTVMFLLAYGAMVAYLLIIKQSMPAVLNIAEAGQGNFAEKEGTMIITSILIILPLSMMRDMAALSKTSLLSVLADVFLTGFVIAYSPVHSTVSDEGGFGKVLVENAFDNQIFIGLGIISFSMACQHSAFIVSNSLKDNNAARWAMVTFRSITTATILCLLMGLSGYLGYLNDTDGNILNNFPSDSIMANAGRVLLCVTMFFTYPMEAFVARHVLVVLLYNGDMDGNTIGPNGGLVPLPRFLGCLGRRHVLTLAIYLVTLIPALIVDDLGFVLSITGAVGASCVAYVASGAIYLGINGEDFLDYCRNLLESRGYKLDKTPKPTEVELPVVGDATATMPPPPGTNDGHHADDIPQIPSGAKPIWWYFGLFPLWTLIAAWGATGTRTFLRNMDQDAQRTAATAANDDPDVVGPRKRDYYISMFFVTFGIVAAVLGVVSNVYVQIHDIYHSPY